MVKKSRRVLQAACAYTKLCAFFVEDGCCPRGRKCKFAHDPAQLTQTPDLSNTKMCRTLLSNGVCTNPRCSYAHTDEELNPLIRKANSTSGETATSTSTEQGVVGVPGAALSSLAGHAAPGAAKGEQRESAEVVELRLADLWGFARIKSKEPQQRVDDLESLSGSTHYPSEMGYPSETGYPSEMGYPSEVTYASEMAYPSEAMSRCPSQIESMSLVRKLSPARIEPDMCSGVLLNFVGQKAPPQNCCGSPVLLPQVHNPAVQRIVFSF